MVIIKCSKFNTMRNFLIILFLSLITFPCQSQDKPLFSHTSIAEKIYLQLDGQVYTTDKNIWFKAIVTDALYHMPTQLSGVLYVELVDSGKEIIDKKLVKLHNGIGYGAFELKSVYPEGSYMIRAYTQWNKNFEDDFIFTEYIQLFSATEKIKTEKADPFRSITIIEDDTQQRQLLAYFDPFAIDSLHKKEIAVFLTLKDKKDSLLIRQDRQKQYFLEYPIDEDCQFVKLQVQTRNKLSNTKTIVLERDYLDLQFFPESGELVHGISGLVGFKALDHHGKGKRVEGEIINEKKEVLARFKSNELGMGSFEIAFVDSTTQYFAHISSKNEQGTSRLYPLPKVVSQGNVLSVKKKNDEILLKITSSYLKNDSISIKAICRGRVYYGIKARLREGHLRLHSLKQAA